MGNTLTVTLNSGSSSGFGGWTFGVTLDTLLDQAITYAGVGTSAPYKQLGANDTDRQTRVAEIVNRIREEVAEANPAVGVSATPDTISVVDGTSEYNIPTDLHGVAIEKIRYQDGQDSSIDTFELEYISDARVSQMPMDWRNGEEVSEYPKMWSYNEDRTKIVLYPEPDASATLGVYYRVQPTSVTQANVADPTNTTLTEMPVRFQHVYALGVARELALYVDMEKAADLRRRFDRELNKMQWALCGTTMSQWMTRGSGRQLPNPVMNLDALWNLETLGKW